MKNQNIWLLHCLIEYIVVVICWEPIKLGQCIDNIKMKIDGLELDEIKMNEILSEVNSLLK